jgi:hypothetical protein
MAFPLHARSDQGVDCFKRTGISAIVPGNVWIHTLSRLVVIPPKASETMAQSGENI